MSSPHVVQHLNSYPRPAPSPADFANEFSFSANFSDISKTGLKKLVELANNVSLMPEEGRYPRFTLYIPPRGIQCPYLSVGYSKPLPLNEKLLHRIAPTIPYRPYALMVREIGEDLHAWGILRIEISGSQWLLPPTIIRSELMPGLHLTINGPGDLTAIPWLNNMVLHTYSMRYSQTHLAFDASTNSLTNLMIQQAVQACGGSLDHQFIGTLWSLILANAANSGHGGAIVVLPQMNDGTIVERALDFRERQTCHPDVLQLASAYRYGKEPKMDIQFQTLREIRYEMLRDATRCIGQLAAVDGCVVLDHRLRLLGFGAQIRSSTTKQLSCARVDPRSTAVREIGVEQMTLFGRRHNSAAELCAEIPGTFVFVVSQDGDIRVFHGVEDRKVLVCGPLTILPAQSAHAELLGQHHFP